MNTCLINKKNAKSYLHLDTHFKFLPPVLDKQNYLTISDHNTLINSDLKKKIEITVIEIHTLHAWLKNILRNIFIERYSGRLVKYYMVVAK